MIKDLIEKYKKKIYISITETDNYWWSKIIAIIIVQYQKRINLLDNNPSQSSKFSTKNWVGINDDSCETQGKLNSQIKFKTSMLKSSLCECSDAYILVKEMITVVQAGAATTDKQEDWKDKQVAFKNYTPFTDCRSEINNIQVYSAKDLNFVTHLYIDNYSKISECLHQFWRDEPNDNWRDSK